VTRKEEGDTDRTYRMWRSGTRRSGLVGRATDAAMGEIPEVAVAMAIRLGENGPLMTNLGRVTMRIWVENIGADKKFDLVPTWLHSELETRERGHAARIDGRDIPTSQYKLKKDAPVAAHSIVLLRGLSIAVRSVVEGD
jgi:hypothetical protein